MERKTRLWLGLSAAVLVAGSTTPTRAALQPTPLALGPDRPADPAAALPGIRIAQAEGGFEGGEGGEGEGGEGGGQVLGTITEFRLDSTDPTAFRYDGSDQIRTYGALVRERYVAAHDGAVTLQAAIAALLAAPSPENLAAARAAWRDARAAYQRTEPFLFYAGPVDGEGGPIARLNAWPINPAFLDYVAGDPNAGLINDPATPINRSTLVRLDQVSDPTNVTTGWHAIEFLLWGEDLSATGPGDRPYTDYLPGGGNNDRRRDALRIITQLLVNDLSTLELQWAPDANNYRAAIEAMDQRNAIGRAFNGMAVLAGYELALKRIGASLRRAGEFEPSQFSDATTADLTENIRAIRDVYFGNTASADGAGFDALVASLDPALNDRVVAAFAHAEAAIAALDTPYDVILASPSGSPARAKAEAAVAALKDLADALRAAGNRLGVLVLIPGV